MGRRPSRPGGTRAGAGELAPEETGKCPNRRGRWQAEGGLGPDPSLQKPGRVPRLRRRADAGAGRAAARRGRIVIAEPSDRRGVLRVLGVGLQLPGRGAVPLWRGCLNRATAAREGLVSGCTGAAVVTVLDREGPRKTAVARDGPPRPARGMVMRRVGDGRRIVLGGKPS